MQKKFEDCVKTMLEIIGENPNREGLIKTPNRVFKAYEFLTSGYTQNVKDILMMLYLKALIMKWFWCVI